MKKDLLKDLLILYTRDTISKYLATRPGERKFGEEVCFIERLEELESHPARYVILGIGEDIGVRANYGRAGTAGAWEAALGAFLNIQSNRFNRPEQAILLGEVDCRKQLEQAEALTEMTNHNVEELGELVIQIDHKVQRIVEFIVRAGKIPILIGGGHNNSYGNISGTSMALDKKINCINFDAHTDFRSLEHRHSGNGFSYAFENGYLNKYFIFGLHENYTSESVFREMDTQASRVRYNFYEEVELDQTKTFSEAIGEAEAFICDDDFGLELDLDAIEGMGSSAMTPSGFSMQRARAFIRHFAKNEKLRYIHFCEGSPAMGLFPNAVAKSIAYLISDSING